MPTALRLLAGNRQKGETKAAVLACNDWLRMGPGRSLVGLLERYRKIPQDTAPTKSLNTLQKWSQRYDWQARAEAYDARIEEEKNRRRQEILQSGLALDHERVVKLKALAELLEEQINYEPGAIKPDEEHELTDDELAEQYRREQRDPTALRPNVWLRDIKGIGARENFERVEVVRFNAPLISEFRATLDDLAKETGGRRQRTVTENIDYSKLNDEQLARIAAGEDILEVILSEYTGNQS